VTVPYRIVLFDFDGTLVDSGAVIVGALRTALDAGGLDGNAEDHATLAGHIGVPLPRLFPDLGMAPDHVERAIAVFQDYFRQHGADGTKPFEGATELLDDLRGHAATVALATAKPVHTALDVVAHLGWTEHLAFVAGANADETGGAKHEVIGRALDQLTELEGTRPDPGDVVMIGDRAGDIAGARHHGIAGIGVTWGFGSREELTGAAPVAVVDSMSELAGLLLPSSDAARPDAVAGG
jgi:phosphoglycolate phosphatase